MRASIPDLVTIENVIQSPKPEEIKTLEQTQQKIDIRPALSGQVQQEHDDKAENEKFLPPHDIPEITNAASNQEGNSANLQIAETNAVIPTNPEIPE